MSVPPGPRRVLATHRCEAWRMRAIRLHPPGGIDGLALDDVETPSPDPGEALVRVHAAAITRDELTWPVDRLPAIPSYELAGIVATVAPDVESVAVGDACFALTPFDRDGVAAEYAAVPADLLVPQPRPLDHVASAAIPLPALSAWQGLFEHGALKEGERVVITGATGGVGHLATQLARWRGAMVIAAAPTEDAEPVDLVFDTAGGDVLREAMTIVRDGGRLVSVADEPATTETAEIDASFFVVEPNRSQLLEITRLVEAGDLQPTIDSVFSLTEGKAAFARSMERGKRGKVVLRVTDEAADEEPAG
jgi:NADPH:quinone reductase-like Zn-dependent oxidoreductase